jgi:hypothetical protein
VNGGAGFNPSLVGANGGVSYPVIGEDGSNAVAVTICLALAAMAICALVATVFFGIYVFHNHGHSHNHDTNLKQESILNDTDYEFVNNDFGNCNGGVDITLYRLVRTGKFVDVFVQGFCRNTSGVGDEMDIDLGFENFPEDYRCPTGSPNDDANVMGVGTAIVPDSNVTAHLQIEANSDADEIDIDFKFSDDVPDGVDVEFAIHANYDVGRCA